MIDTDDELPNYITFKNVVILITCIINDDAKFYAKIFLEEALYDKHNTKYLKKISKELMPIVFISQNMFQSIHTSSKCYSINKS